MPSNDEMQRTKHGLDGASPLISVLDGHQRSRDVTRLPGEVAAVRSVARKHRQELAHGDSLLAFVIQVIGGGGVRIGKSRGLDQTTLEVVFGLYAKSCKTYRALLSVVRLGLAEDAFALSRVLFETVVAVLFILQTRSRERSRMYVAYLAVQERKMLNSWKQTKGLKRRATKAMVKVVGDRIREAEQVLGTQLVASLKRGYSGMNIEQTVGALGGAKAYNIYYRHASTFSHASDLKSHVTYDTNHRPVLHFGPEASDNLARVLAVSYAAMWTLVNRVNGRMGLGHDARAKQLKRTW